jgi:hypothetical protein
MQENIARNEKEEKKQHGREEAAGKVPGPCEYLRQKGWALRRFGRIFCWFSASKILHLLQKPLQRIDRLSQY